MEWLLTTVVENAVKVGVIERHSCEHATVDSTVMEKNIAYPTDSALLEKPRAKLVAFMQEHELYIRQTYSRQGPRTAQQIGRYAHAKFYQEHQPLSQSESGCLLRIDSRMLIAIALRQLVDNESSVMAHVLQRPNFMFAKQA